METCLGFGDIVNHLVDSGRMRRVDKQEALEIKAQAEQAGLVNFTSDLLQGRLGGSSCSCCSCCCHALRTVTEFNMPGLIAPPHFRPQLDETQCLYCGKCARACPMGAIIVEPKAKTYQYLPERCIGCGLCAVACDKKHAITMLAEPNYQPPPGSMLAALWQVLPNYLRNAWSAWRKYQR
jgi:Pyruvate/2-oxoacid:ferredoxin oxidoreductase delta subunit